MSENCRKIAGVMGGMGPDATVDFMSKVIALTGGNADQDHIHMIIDHDPGVPNRQLAMQSGEDDVSAPLGAMARRLEAAGADFLVMVCNTAHAFLADVRSTTSIPFISIIDVSVGAIDAAAPQATRIGVMATDACLEASVYQDAIAATGRTAIVPEGQALQRLMCLINAIKAGDQGDAIQQGMREIGAFLCASGAEILIAGCTEIPLVFDASHAPVPVIASTDALAQRTVDIAKGLVTISH